MCIVNISQKKTEWSQRGHWLKLSHLFHKQLTFQRPNSHWGVRQCIPTRISTWPHFDSSHWCVRSLRCPRLSHWQGPGCATWHTQPAQHSIMSVSYKRSSCHQQPSSPWYMTVCSWKCLCKSLCTVPNSNKHLPGWVPDAPLSSFQDAGCTFSSNHSKHVKRICWWL